MELWKVHQFCQQASLEALREKFETVSQAMLQGQLNGTNAAVILGIIRQYILKAELDDLFNEED